jgi:hypothetical protein
MAWNASVNSLAGVGFYVQDDSLWQAKPDVTPFTPIEAVASVLQYSGCPSHTRSVSGYVTSQANYDTLLSASQLGTTVQYNGENVVIINVTGKLVFALNLSFLSLVGVQLIKV